MSENGNGNSEAKFTTPFGSASFSGKRTAEIITFMLAIGVAVLGYAFYVHGKESDDNGRKLVEVLEGFSKAQQEHTKAIRLQTCVFAHAGEDRRAQFMEANSLCKRMAE